jgi:hypothetical protein
MIENLRSSLKKECNGRMDGFERTRHRRRERCRKEGSAQTDDLQSALKLRWLQQLAAPHERVPRPLCDGNYLGADGICPLRARRNCVRGRISGRQQVEYKCDGDDAVWAVKHTANRGVSCGWSWGEGGEGVDEDS